MTAVLERSGGDAPVAPRRSATRGGRGADAILVGALCAILLISLVAVYTAAAGTGLEGAFAAERSAFYLQRHLLWLAVGCTALAVTYGLDHRVWRRFSTLIYAATLVALAFVVAAGPEGQYGADRWFLGGSGQPAELAKLAVVIYVADWLAGRDLELRQWKLGIVPFAILMSLVCGLIILQRDYSTAVLVLAIGSAMLCVAGADPRQLVIAGFVATIVLAGFIVTEQYRYQRLQTWLHADADPSGANYQLDRSLAAFTSGGWLGVGLGNGQVKHAFPLDTAHTDAVFAVIAEESGAVGCLVILVLFALVFWRGMRVATGLHDRFGSLMAAGIATWFAAQALVHMAVLTGLIPFTGMPMPFLSYGGSSMLACLAAAGILLRLSTRIDPERASFNGYMDFRRRYGRARLSGARRARRAGLTG